MECLDDLAEDKNLILDDLAKISVFFFFLILRWIW